MPAAELSKPHDWRAMTRSATILDSSRRSLLGPTLSRRTLIGAVTVTIVCGLGSAADDRPETNWARGAAGVASDRRLSPAFLRNAYGFYRAAVARQGRFPNDALYSLAIASELSLKAYLLHRGVSDDWNRIHIRHDLRRALAFAEAAGFRQAPGGLADLASSLTPFYERHAIHWRATEITVPADVPHACDTVRALLGGVAGQIDRETAKHSWMARPHWETANA